MRQARLARGLHGHGHRMQRQGRRPVPGSVRLSATEEGQAQQEA